MPGVDRGTEKPVDDCLHGNGEEYANVYEREWELFSLLFAFLLPSLCFWCFVFFPPPPPQIPALRFLVGSTWSLFLGISLLLSRPRQCLCVCVWCVCVCRLRRCLDRIGGYCSLLTQQVLVWLHSGGFVCSTFTLLKHRKGRAAQAARLKGITEIKERVLFSFPYTLVGSLSTAFTFRKHTTIISRPLFYLFPGRTFIFICTILRRCKGEIWQQVVQSCND